MCPNDVVVIISEIHVTPTNSSCNAVGHKGSMKMNMADVDTLF